MTSGSSDESAVQQQSAIMSQFKLAKRRSHDLVADRVTKRTSSISCSKSDELAISRIAFDVNSSLVDQVKRVSEPTVSSQQVKMEMEACGSNVAEESNQSFNFRELQLEVVAKTGQELSFRQTPARFTSTLEYLGFIGASHVPLDAFVHVLVEFKSNPHKFPASCTETSSGGGVDCLTTNSIKHHHLMSAGSSKPENSFVKFEYLHHGDNNKSSAYWPVKIRRYFANLYQMKVLADTTWPSLKSQVVNSDTAASADPIEPVAGAEQSHHDSSLNHSITANFSSAVASSVFFVVDSTPATSRLRSALDSCLRPSGWSKKQGLRLERPPVGSFKIAADFFSPQCQDDDNGGYFTDHFHLNKNNSNEPVGIGKQHLPGSYCELQDELDPLVIDIVRVEKNIGGRLLLSYLEPTRDHESKDVERRQRPSDLWLFFLDFRVHPLGWARTSGAAFKYDRKQVAHVVQENPSLQSRLADPSVAMTTGTGGTEERSWFMLNDHELLNRHDFKVNYLMECLYQNQFYVAKVVQVVNEFFFKIQIDVNDQEHWRPVQLVCHKSSLNQLRDNGCHILFPCKWCSRNRLKLNAPRDWPAGKGFDWDLYLQQQQLNIPAESANPPVLLTDSSVFDLSSSLAELAEKFQLGSFLECVDTTSRSSIFLGRIQAKVDHLLFIQPVAGCGSGNHHLQPPQLRIYSASSFDLFPVGWCEVNGYEVSNESNDNRFKELESSIADARALAPRVELRRDLLKIPLFRMFKYHFNWCQAICINTSVHLGPFFSKEKLDSGLPKLFGPGPIVLILVKMIQMLLNSSNKPLRLIKQLQTPPRDKQLHERCKSQTNNMVPTPFQPHRVRLKARENEKYIYRAVEVCSSIYQLRDYLIDLCHKLRCCTKMITLDQEPDQTSSTSSVCSNVTCCVACTLNYYSFNANSTNPVVVPAKPKDVETKRVTNLAREKGAKRSHSHMPVQRVIRSLKKKRQLEAANSPIKTRLNVKQTLLLNKYKQQQEQKLKELAKEDSRVESSSSAKKSNPSEKTAEKSASKRSMKLNHRLVHTPSSKYKFGGGSSASKLKHAKYLLKKSATKAQPESSSSTSSTSENDEQHHHQSTRRVQKRLQSEFDETATMTVKRPVGGHTPSPQLGSNHAISPATSQMNNFISNANMASVIQSSARNFSNLNTQPSIAVVAAVKNPLEYSIDDVCRYLQENKADQHIVQLIREQEIDGQSFLMLTLPTIQNFMNLKFGPAIKLSHLVEKLKLIYTQNFKS